MRHVDIAIFAHNEERNLAALIDDLARQTLIWDPNTELQIRILCNACRDKTVLVAKRALLSRAQLIPIAAVDDLAEGGKSRTWNRYVSQLRDDSDSAVFMDGDIRISDADALSNLVEDLLQSDGVAVTSRPLKDLRRLRRRPLLRTATSLTGRDHRDGPIAGSLYAIETRALRQIRLPVPCLVEDGFLSACLVTGLFACQGQPERVRASRRVCHYFEPPGSLREFFRHDVRLALGAELNAALYTDLWQAESVSNRIEMLHQFSVSFGIDHSIDEHLKHPERSALRWKNLFSPMDVSNKDGFFSTALRLAFRFGHLLYMAVVFHRSRKLFAERRFRW